jgi:hypothetical protein
MHGCRRQQARKTEVTQFEQTPLRIYKNIIGLDVTVDYVVAVAPFDGQHKLRDVAVSQR